MATRNRTQKTPDKSLANEVLAVVILAAAILLLLALLTYEPADPSGNTAVGERDTANLIGIVGAYLSDFFLQLFGLAALSMPVLLGLIAWRVFFSERARLPVRKTAGAGLLLIALSGFLALFPKLSLDWLTHASSNGGMVGYVVESALAGFLNTAGAAIVLAVASVLTLMLTMEVSLADVVGRLRGMAHGAKAARASTKPAAGVMTRLSDWWAGRLEAHRARSAEKAAQREADLKQREREERVRAETERKAAAARALEEARRKAEQAERDEEAAPRREEIPITPPKSPAVVTSPVAAEPLEMADGEDEEALGYEEDIKAPPAPAPARAGLRSEAAAAVRAYTANKQARASASASDDEVTMDPEVAEMVSTASIVRTAPTEKADPAQVARESRRKPEASFSQFKLPPIDMLDAPIGHFEQAEDELRVRATTLAEKCKEFSVTGHIHRINPGPVVTTFEFKPDPGIKVARVTALADDLCLALKAESIRIDRIPGKSTVGIEVPNDRRETIHLRDILESAKFQHSDSKLTLALGKTINGEEYVADLAKMPHLLIAGATGAGKSVTLNAIVCSILYKATPDDVKFIMVDPKRLELGLYEGIPHLLTPIVTDPKRAANALRWAVNEMENRYKTLAALGVRNIDQYNRQVREMTHPTLSEDDPNAHKPLPYIVIAIDELADLMMVARGEVETSIARLAQMARAVGIHLIVATQRPSVDVITGVIKANFPSRIAFRVSSKVDSRTIIDANGAESLLGQGDMLFLPPASARLIRVHGSFVNEAEIKRVMDFIRNQAKPDYNESVTLSEQEAEEAQGGFVGERDELYDEALAIVIDMGRASTSVLQRRLSIGYGRAAKILDMMEREGFIGPGEGSKPRKVLPAAFEFRERLAERIEEPVE